MFENATSCSFQGVGNCDKRNHHHHHQHHYASLQPAPSSPGVGPMGAALNLCGSSHVQVKVEECATPDWLGCSYRYGVTKCMTMFDSRKNMENNKSNISTAPARCPSASAFTNVPPILSSFHHPPGAAATPRSEEQLVPLAPSAITAAAHSESIEVNGSRSAPTDSAAGDKRSSVPTDPSLWSPAQVKLWLQWASREFRLGAVDFSKVTIPGKELCRLSQDEFVRLVTDEDPYPGQILYMHLSYLRQIANESIFSSKEKSTNSTSGGNKSTAYTHFNSSADANHPLRLTKAEPSYKSAWGSHASTQSQGFPHNTIHGMSKPPLDAHPHTHLRQDPYQMFGPTSSRLASSGSGQIQLWQFLLELLSDSSNANCITWEGTNGEFKLTDPDEVARRWGERKSKPNMNYDKLSRALRYYYDKNIMTKVHGKRYAYKFDFQGLAAATQPAAADPTAYKYQSDLFMSASYHTSPKLNFVGAHAAIPSSSGAIFPSPTSYWTNPGANLYTNIAAASGHGMSHHPSHVTPHIGSYSHYA